MTKTTFFGGEGVICYPLHETFHCSLCTKWSSRNIKWFRNFKGLYNYHHLVQTTNNARTKVEMPSSKDRAKSKNSLKRWVEK